ncbi:MAG: 3-hydroxyisobutyrate dehydrogenase [Betaproteobacteria bacterium RIFCSPHIGHO2_12_FULL_69_13]|nr:MAG: 3-hydroxyisobutyrate dehydrogenase [Betaproteobacteria bacterium RIFCSPHIGHO2_12_FULL_69_13]
MKIGIAGTGRMGAAIATRLLGLGHEVSVWNRSAAKTRPLAGAGARVADTPQRLARESEAVVTILTDDAAIEGVYGGKDGLLAADVAGKLFVEMSTVRPDTERALAARVRARGAALVECPVGGTVGPAKEGRLFGFVGGELADVARARPLLEQLCRRVEHVGPVGAGAAMKLAINLPLMVYWQALGEALSLIRPLALDPARVIDILGDTSGAPNVLKARGATIAAALAGTPPGAVTFDVDSMRKDVRAMLDEAQALGRSLPVTERALECFDRAAREGLGAADCSMVSVHWALSET